MLLLGVLMSASPVTADVAANPARIQAGTCPEVGTTVVVLDDLVGEWMPEPLGSADPVTHPVRTSVTRAVPVAYEELFSAPHSLAVALAPGAGLVLCGDLHGYPLTRSDIAIGLGQLNDSGFSGIATIHDNGDATIDVAVYLTTREAWIGDID